MTLTKTVRLTDKQIEAIRESLKWTAKRYRDYDHSGSGDPAWVLEHRRKQDEQVEAIRVALALAE
jgi:hypothetical protein